MQFRYVLVPQNYIFLLFISVNLEALNKPLIIVHVRWQEVKEVLEAAFLVHFRVLLIDQLLGTVDLFIHGETMDAGNRNS